MLSSLQFKDSLNKALYLACYCLLPPPATHQPPYMGLFERARIYFLELKVLQNILDSLTKQFVLLYFEYIEHLRLNKTKYSLHIVSSEV